MRIYLDSDVTIYLVERVSPYHQTVSARLAAPGIVVVASELTRMECLVQPVHNADQPLILAFEDFFRLEVAVMVSFSRAVFDRTIQIRAQHPCKTPDALHLAAAMSAGCDVFLTHDQQLAGFPGITVEVI